MAKIIHNFAESLDKGKAAEKVIDEHLSKYYEIATVSLEVEKTWGIDRLLRRLVKQPGIADVYQKMTAEYKTDFQAHETHNVFLETAIGRGVEMTPGWALSSYAQLLVYYIPGLEVAYFADMIEMRRELVRTWINTCKAATAENEGWWGHGLLVPRELFKHHCVMSEITIRNPDNGK